MCLLTLAKSSLFLQCSAVSMGNSWWQYGHVDQTLKASTYTCSKMKVCLDPSCSQEGVSLRCSLDLPICPG